MEPKGLSAEETRGLINKLRNLRSLILTDQETLEAQKKELSVKEKALLQIYSDLEEVKQDLTNKGGLSETEFRAATSKYLQSIRNDVDYLRQNRSLPILTKKPLRVVITGAAGQVGYALVPLFASGQVFGLDQPLILTLLEVPQAFNLLKGSVLEIEDGAYPLVEAVIPTTDHAVAFKEVDYAILVGGFPRGAGMERKDLLAKNAPIFQTMGESLDKYAKDTCKVLVVANPANTNCLICSRHAKKLPKHNFAALTRLDQNRATAQVARKLGVPVRTVSNVIIWGNHSNTQVPDAAHAVVTTDGARKPVHVDEKWERDEFTQSVQQRGKAILDARGLTSALSAANAVKDCIHDWHFGTPEGDHVAMAVYSDGSYYGIAKDIFYSVPVACRNGTYSVVSDLKISGDVEKLMKKTEEELLAERHEANLDKQ